MKNWIAIEKRLPTVELDFETFSETQYISKPIMLKLKRGWFKESEIDGYHVVLNGHKLWSLDPCGTGNYWELDIATSWKYK